MSGEANWPTATDVYDYLGNQNKKLGVADRRPVIRKAADLVGPGIDAQAIPVTNLNDVLATYNGFYSAVAGAAGAPKVGEAFVGFTVMDSAMGGVQRFTSMTTKIDYKRVFQRNPSDPESIFWGAWQTGSGEVPIGAFLAYGGSVAPEGWLICDGTSYAVSIYPLLYGVFGTTYGGSGATFNVPDLRDRTVYGAGSSWYRGGTDGLALGARTINLYHNHEVIVRPIEDHTHSVAAAVAHNHGGGGSTSNPTTGISTRGSGGVDTPGPSHNHNFNIPDAGQHSHGGATGGGGSHFHTGSSFDETTMGPKARGVGGVWIVKHGS